MGMVMPGINFRGTTGYNCLVSIIYYTATVSYDSGGIFNQGVGDG